MSVPFKRNFGQICGLQIYNTLLYTIYSPQIGPKLHLKAGIKEKKLFLPHSFGLPIILPTTYLFRAPLVAKIGKRSNGHLHWDAVEAWCNNFDQM